MTELSWGATQRSVGRTSYQRLPREDAASRKYFDSDQAVVRIEVEGYGSDSRTIVGAAEVDVNRVARPFSLRLLEVDVGRIHRAVVGDSHGGGV